MATSLNALTLRINADTSGMAAGVKLVRRDLNSVNSTMRRAAGDAGKLQAATQSLDNVMAAGAISQSEYARAQKAINHQYGGGRQAAQKAAEATRQANSMVAASIPPTTKLAQQIRLLRSEYAAGNVSQDSFLRTNRRLREEYRKLKTATDGTTDSMARARASMDKWRASQVQTSTSTGTLIGRVKGLLVAYAGFHAITSTFRLAMDLETSAIAFQTLTGSAEKGKEVLADLKALAASTPLTLPGLSQAEKTLLNFGVALEKTVPMLKQLGDISGGNEQRLQSLALVMGQVSANGRLNGQDLLQFVNVGFNPLNEMVKTTGKSMEQLRTEMSKGQISTKMVEDALSSATSAGGLFFGMLDNNANTTAGQLTLLASEVQTLGSDLLTLLFPVVKDVAGGLRSIVKWIKDFGSDMSDGEKKTLTFVGALGSIVLIGPKLVAVARTVVLAVRSWVIAQTALLAVMNPAMLAVAAFAAAGATYALTEAFAAEDAANEAATEKTKQNTVVTLANIEAKRAQANALALVAKQQKSTETYIEQYEALQQQNLAMKMGADWEEKRLAMVKNRTMLEKGYSQKQIDNLNRLEKENDALTLAKKEEEERNKLVADRQKQVKDSLKSIGDSLRKSLETPYDGLVQKLAEINAAVASGQLSSAQAARARQMASGEFRDNNKPIKVELPPSIARGSREEYKMLADRMSNTQSREEARFREQVALQRAQVDASERTNEILEGREEVGGVG